MRRSFALRAALAVAALMLAVSLAGALWVWRQGEAALRGQLDLALAAEAEALVREYETLGLEGLAAQAEAYARRRGPVLVLLQAADGRRIAGDAPDAAPLRGYATLSLPDGRSLRALGGGLPGGTHLVVAADLAGVEGAATRLARTPPLAAFGAALLALLGGFLAARRLERRLAGAGAAARLIMDGDLTRRLPCSGAGDEFDRLAATMNTLLARIEALVAAQRQVTDDIAHDLRTPLSRLRQRLEAALGAPRGAAADAETLEATLAELDGVLATFTLLLRIARVESGAGRAAFQAVDLASLLRGLHEAYAPVAEEAGGALLLDLAPLPPVRGDATLLRQAVAHLLDNALVHGAAQVTLRLRPGPEIDVEDDGPGIPPDEREAVLRRFHRLDRSRATPGTGLGLALVAATAHLHGGEVRIGAGAGGNGTMVTLRLGPELDPR